MAFLVNFHVFFAYLCSALVLMFLSVDTEAVFSYIFRYKFTAAVDWRDVALSTSGQNIIAAGSGAVYLSSDGGSTWGLAPLSTSLDYQSVASDATGTTLYVGANFNGIYRSKDGGASWNYVIRLNTTQTSIYVNAISCSSDGVYVAATRNPGGILISRDSGNTWTLTVPSSNYIDGWNDVQLTPTANLLYVATYYGMVVSTDLGTSWRLMYGVSGNWNSIACSSNGAVIASTFNRYVYLSTNYGNSFSYLGGMTDAYKVSIDETGAILTVITSKSVDQSDNYGASWKFLASTGSQATAIVNTPSTSSIYVTIPYYGVYAGEVVTSAPTFAPTTAAPTTISPTPRPSFLPTGQPTSQPTSRPSQPTSQPSRQPSKQPIVRPTGQPTRQPSRQPSRQPTSQPTSFPSTPTSQPSRQPTRQPISRPTGQPSSQPTRQPSRQPSSKPTSNPTNPTSQPTSVPSGAPTSMPTGVPPCPVGTYFKFIPGGYLCISCNPGTYSPGRVGKCLPCVAGSFSETNGTSVCTLCPLNTYQSKTGATSCSTCPSSDVTGQLGSIGKDQCVNPATNFIFGGVCLFLSFLAIIIYLYQGRLLRIAFQRKYRLVRKSIILYGATARAADLVSSVSGIVLSIVRKGQHVPRWKRILKPLLFIVLAAIVVPVVAILVIAYNASHILFNSLVLWRGYKFYFRLPLDFYNQIHLFLKLINISFGVDFFQYLAYPFVVIATFFAGLSINLDTVQVTCPGSQAPIYLLIDIAIVGVVIIIIKSDLQIFWTTALSNVLTKARNLLFSRFFFSKHVAQTIWFAVWSVVFNLFPEPRKLIQYALGFVKIGTFFEQEGRTRSSVNCDGALSIQVDTLLAIATTAFSLFMLTPIIFILAEVLVPCFRRERMIKVVKQIVTSGSKGANQAKKAVTIDVRGVEVDANHAEAPMVVDGVIVDKIDIDENNDFASDDDEPNKPEGCCNPRRFGSWVIRIFSMLSSFDWFYVKGLCAYAASMFYTYQSFVVMKHKEAADPKKRFPEEQEQLLNIRNEASYSELPVVPWFQAIHELSSKEKIQLERKEEKVAWNKYKREFPSFGTVVRSCRRDLLKNHSIKCVPYFVNFILYYIASYQVIFQIMTEKGWAIWVRVVKNYVVILLISFGMWPEFAVQEFNLIPEFTTLSRWLKKVEGSSHAEYIRHASMLPNDVEVASKEVTDPDVDEEVQRAAEKKSKKAFKNQGDAFARIDNDPKLFFMNYVSSIVSARVVLIQLVPILTLWSILAVELAQCPIFVFSKSMHDRLPPLIVWEPAKVARKLLRLDYKGRDPPSWKVYILAAYLFVRESRLVQFTLRSLMVVVSTGLVFFPDNVHILVIILMFMLLFVGVLTAFYVLLLLHKLLFPTEDDQPDATGAAPNSTTGYKPTSIEEDDDIFDDHILDLDDMIGDEESGNDEDDYGGDEIQTFVRNSVVEDTENPSYRPKDAHSTSSQDLSIEINEPVEDNNAEMEASDKEFESVGEEQEQEDGDEVEEEVIVQGVVIDSLHADESNPNVVVGTIVDTTVHQEANSDSQEVNSFEIELHSI